LGLGRQNALDSAQQPAGDGRCDIQVLGENWDVVETITREDLKPVAWPRVWTATFLEAHHAARRLLTGLRYSRARVELKS
jgi:hypothetical protein